MAHTKTIGQGTLLDLLKYSIANLFSAAMKLKRCVVVVASLDAAYDEARRILGGQLADLQKETSRGAKSITPVDLNTGEIYDILRKRLFTSAGLIDFGSTIGAVGPLASRVKPEHRAQKWEPVLRKKRCDTENIERASCVRFNAARSSSAFCRRRRNARLRVLR